MAGRTGEWMGVQKELTEWMDVWASGLMGGWIGWREEHGRRRGLKDKE